MIIQTLPQSKNQNITNTAFDAQTVCGGESKWLLLLEIAFPELHFTALCWIHSSGNSSWMFHHRSDSRDWYNPLITHTHSLWGTFTSCMCIWEDMRVNWMPFHLLGKGFYCIFNVGGYKHDRMSRQAAIDAIVALVAFRSFIFIYDARLQMQFLVDHGSIAAFVKNLPL